MALHFELMFLGVVALLATRSFAGVAPSADDESSGERRARWFLNRETVTQSLLDKRLITQYAPWSCVVVEPSLPPCRHVRQLDIQSTRTAPVMSTTAPVLDEGVSSDNGLGTPSSRQGRGHGFYNDQGYPGLSASMDSDYYATPPLTGGWVQMTMPTDFSGREAPANAVPAPVNGVNAVNGQPVAGPFTQPQGQPPANNIQGTPTVVTPSVEATASASSEVGWAQWLGLRQPPHTVTHTVTSYETIKFVDPDTVVTFSFRGCKPTKLPFDLPFCHDSVQSPFPPPAPNTIPSDKNAPAVDVLPNGKSPVPPTTNTTTSVTPS